MPRKASLDVKGINDAMQLDKGAKKTERSHEENQERAYIAASRRVDRSIEARVQSARMASEIHKKRTGKGFKITEEIVLKEEMYEEEDDDLPRSYRLLSASMQTSSPEMNARLNAYLSNKVAMSQMLARTNDEWRENEVNRLFAASFPNALPISNLPPPKHQSPPEAFSPRTNSSSTIAPPTHSASFSGALPTTTTTTSSVSTSSPLPPDSAPSLQQRHSVASLPWPPRASKPSKPKSRTSDAGVNNRRNSSKSSATLAKKKSVDMSGCTPMSENAISPQSFYEHSFPGSSAFTTELPAEARMMFNGVGADGALDPMKLMGGGLEDRYDGYFPEWMNPDTLFDSVSFPRSYPSMDLSDDFGAEHHGNGAEDPMGANKYTMLNSQPSFDGGEWRNFINDTDSMWVNDQ
ncbi:hypothetical protein E4U31_006263 [Claviceps sp. LM219 group G6]|nr:hypothetical protein E4U31_006263 [Claviceps sp. LM219 group G6]